MKLPEKKFIGFFLTISCFLLFSYAQYDPSWLGADRAENPLSASTDLRTDLNKVDSILDVHNHIRSNIERDLDNLKKVELHASELNPSFVDKWSKIHYYSNEEEVVRIKTYGKEANNDRSEEFYLHQGELIMAVVEDHGSDSYGPAMKFEGKRFYFSEGEFVYASHINIEQLEEGDPTAENLKDELRTYLTAYGSFKSTKEI